MMHEVRYELASETETGMHYIIDDLSWSGQWAWPELGPAIFDLLKESEPHNVETLNKLLRMVLALARQRLDREGTCHAVQWYAVWTGVDPENAIPAFAAYLERLTPNRQSVDEAMSYATYLFGDRHSDFAIREGHRSSIHAIWSSFTSFFTIISIAPRISIGRTVRSIHPPCGTVRKNSRNAIFNLLNSISGKEAYLAMTNIAASETDAEVSRWIAHRARQRAEQDADMGAWTPEQVREFHDEQERTPRNHRELAELAINHLLDLKNDLEDGDESVAAAVLQINEEEILRNFIGRYQISQEEELADEKRTDLRFHGIGIEGAVPTELKIADKWSGPQLYERLENQLSGDYLRDRRSSRGIFLLVNRGKERQRWQRSDGTMVDFAGIVAALQEHWESLSPRYPGVEEIRVIGIDLPKRFL